MEVFDAGPTLTDRINFQGYLRLRPNATPVQLEAELAVLSAQLGPNTETGKPLVYVLRSLTDEVVGDLGSTVLLLSGATPEDAISKDSRPITMLLREWGAGNKEAANQIMDHVTRNATMGSTLMARRAGK